VSDGLRRLLEQVRAGDRSVDEALAALQAGGTAPRARELGFATVDHDRARRCGFPEVVFCPGKRPADAAAIAVEILTRADRVLLTRAEPAHAEAVLAARPDAVWHRRARCVTVTPPDLPQHGLVAVASAGTSDLPVADEAAVTLRTFGNRVEQFTDVGVAGLHRLLAHIDRIRAANVVIACAGMEGALPSVLAGLLDRPLVAVPTSIGYGASFDGLAALLTMLNGCAAGVGVVNIDNGFGAGYLASLVNLRIAGVMPPGAPAPSGPPPAAASDAVALPSPATPQHP
jgi:NCAIR mutase (PurE)-related protein